MGSRRTWIASVAVTAVLAVSTVVATGPARGESVSIAIWGGTGTGNGQLDAPSGIATDADGNVYVADQFNDRVQKFTAFGTFTRAWGTGGTGPGQFNGPFDVAIGSQGRIYVADAGNNRIQVLSPTGVHITSWGEPGTGDGQFNGPLSLTTDSAGNVYVADFFNDRVQKFTDLGTYVTQWGTLGTAPGELDGPWGMVLDADDNVYVADLLNSRIQKFDSSGAFISTWATSFHPQALDIDRDGNVYVTDLDNDQIHVFSPAGVLVDEWGGTGTGVGQLSVPYDLTIAPNGDVFVAELVNDRVQKFEMLASITIVEDSVNDHAQDFGYTIGPGTFALDDDVDPGLANTVTFEGLRPGSFYVRQNVVAGWALTGLVCDNGEAIDFANRRALVRLDSAEHVTCTFTNTQLGSVTIVEDAAPNDAQDFGFTGNFGLNLDDDNDPGFPSQHTFSGVVPGPYVVTQGPSPPAGWPLSGLSCDTGESIDVPTRTANIVLDPGEHVVCTFTNTKELRPDALVNTSSIGTFAGDNVYNTTGSGQSKSKSVKKGASGTYYLRFQNDSTTWTEPLLVKGGASGSGFTVSYLSGTSGSTSITSQVVAGTYSTGALAPGASKTIRMVVKVATSVPKNKTRSVTVTARSSGLPAVTDAVKTTTKAI